MTTTKGKLNERFLQQDFGNSVIFSGELEKFRMLASGYAQIENAIAVLSDLKERKSNIFYGGMAQVLGMSPKGQCCIVDSIWEEEIFKAISANDLERKHLDELKFIHFLKNRPADRLTDYCLTNILSIKGSDGREYRVCHRVFYVGVEPNGSIRLALCLYNLTDDKGGTDSFIRDTNSGKTYSIEQQDFNNLLSRREKEVLALIKQGLTSKQISKDLSISLYTVSRHRQNILSKLRATNSIDACRIAKQLELI